MHQARRLAERYGLDAELEGFVYAAGCVALTGVAVSDLDALVGWLRQLGDRVETACDRFDAPPAR